MTLQNRVLPDGTIAALPCRGDFMGNRGILHDGQQRLGVARWRHKNWITCLTEFRGRKRTPMQPGNYTELFFLDEATAFAAGHRPCAECRRADYNRFLAAWEAAFGTRPAAKEVDRILHAARIVPGTRDQLCHAARCEELPDGTFLRREDGHWLVSGDRLLRFRPDGYDRAMPRPGGRVTVMTPAPLVAVLARGYRPARPPTATA